MSKTIHIPKAKLIGSNFVASPMMIKAKNMCILEMSLKVC